ncbi:MAG: hypothetical protein JNL76_00425 [Alphaproteobacteria bacterium]|nr:hypothetical protein [Alphaproteobacteria bacterium]
MSQEIPLTLDGDLQLALMEFFEKQAPKSVTKLLGFGDPSNFNNFLYLMSWRKEYHSWTGRFAFPVIDQLTYSSELAESIRSLDNILFTPNYTPTQIDIENIHALPDRLEEIVDYLDRYLGLLKEVEQIYQKPPKEGPQPELVTKFERAVRVDYATFSRHARKEREEIYPVIVADGRKFIEELRQVLTPKQALSVIPAIGNDRSP